MSDPEHKIGREELSAPPRDDVLLLHIVRNLLDEHPDGSILSMSELVQSVRWQCPKEIANPMIAQAIVTEVMKRDVAVTMDNTAEPG